MKCLKEEVACLGREDTSPLQLDKRRGGGGGVLTEQEEFDCRKINKKVRNDGRNQELRNDGIYNKR